MKCWRIVIRNRHTHRNRTRYVRAWDHADAAAQQRRRMNAGNWAIVAINEISEAEYVRHTRGD